MITKSVLVSCLIVFLLCVLFGLKYQNLLQMLLCNTVQSPFELSHDRRTFRDMRRLSFFLVIVVVDIDVPDRRFVATTINNCIDGQFCR